MIQRIQTIYLILALAALSVMLFAPICSYADGENTLALYLKSVISPEGAEASQSNLGLFILLPVTMVSILLTIFLYKDRQKQMALGRLIYLLLAGLITLSMFFIEWNKTGSLEVSGYGIGYFAPVAALPFIFLANRSIKKDEELVKSLDRLR